MMLKEGKTVTIYEDPLTCKKVEGKAKLIEKLHETEEMEFWRVQFFGRDEPDVGRWIKKE